MSAGIGPGFFPKSPRKDLSHARTPFSFGPMEACPPTRCGQAQLLPSVARRGSGDKQALAKLGRVEIDEVAVAFGPPAGCKVITEAAHCPPLGVPPDSGPDR